MECAVDDRIDTTGSDVADSLSDIITATIPATVRLSITRSNSEVETKSWTELMSSVIVLMIGPVCWRS